MSFYDYSVLATSWINQRALGKKPARTLLVGAAILHIRHRFGGWSFDVQAHSTSVTDNPADTMMWLAERLWHTSKLLLWRAEDIVVPSLIAAADTAADVTAAAQLLRRLDHAFGGELIDVALLHGGSGATSFDQVAHAHGVAFVPMSKNDLAEAHRTGDHGWMRQHLSARATGTWRLWLSRQSDVEELDAATLAWIAEQEGVANATRASV